MNCSLCHSVYGGAYRDWATGLNYNLCIPCCTENGFEPNRLNWMKKCQSCNKHFSPKRKFIKVCDNCSAWVQQNKERYKNYPKKAVKSVKPVPNKRVIVFRTATNPNQNKLGVFL